MDMGCDDLDWDEEMIQETKDLFSEQVFKSCEECLKYMKEAYGFDLKETVTSRAMDLFDAIKYVNYIRWHVAEGATHDSQDWAKAEVPQDEQLLIPVVEADPLLQIVEFDDDEDEDVPACPTMLQLIHKDLEQRRQDREAAGDGATSTGSTRALALDEFCYRQFDDPDYGGTKIAMSKEEFEWRANAAYNERCAGLGHDAFDPNWPVLARGYAPFCKHLFVENFLPDCTVPVAEITDDNRHLLRTGYGARTPQELPVLSRWFPKGSVPEEPAKYLDLILYSREQLDKEAQAMGQEASKQTAPWGIISVKAQAECYETPMQPITIMRNALISEGGSGVDIDRETYLKSVQYWKERAVIS